MRSLVKPLLNTAGNPDAKLAPRRGAGSASRWVCCVNGRARWRGLISCLAELHNYPALPSDPQVSPDFDGRSSGILVVHDPRRREYVTRQWLRRDSCGSPLCANSRCRPDAGTVLSITAESVYLQCKDFSAKTLVHSRFWSPDAQVPPSELPSTGGAIRKCGASLGRA